MPAICDPIAWHPVISVASGAQEALPLSEYSHLLLLVGYFAVLFVSFGQHDPLAGMTKIPVSSL